MGASISAMAHDRENPVRNEKDRCAVAALAAVDGEHAHARQAHEDPRQFVASEVEIAECPRQPKADACDARQCQDGRHFPSSRFALRAHPERMRVRQRLVS